MMLRGSARDWLHDDDNELIEVQLEPGEYHLRVYGYLNAANDYVLMRTEARCNGSHPYRR